MNLPKRTRLCLGLPWYDGPDATTTPLNLAMQSYFGALRERTLWRTHLGHDRFMELLPLLPPLDETQGDSGLAEPTEDDWKRLGILDLMISDFSRTSLVGKAREGICEMALGWNADYLLFWDADMLYDYSAFFKLWRHKKPVVAALAFTSRYPIHPVIYTITRKYDPMNQQRVFEASKPIFDYPRDRLISDEDVGGEIAFGAGVMLIDTKVFKEVPQPWFASTGCGEDWFFCYRLAEHNIRRFVDTSVKTHHKIHMARWANEGTYWLQRDKLHESYVAAYGDECIKRPPELIEESAG